ncbi:hypothetical protein H7J08_08490 [Mycobacterium frederiksbergense]|uniref:hypothetical protein n=1 Tax=Mycolicibacterium frederiksbergense TaxID=117567 RepID=UPI0021F31834|nr:hypothetical protein [Mycolicibacterium frederiksbergense]MCV7044712.1 hypothetical protein [Mycolicibacterium frederiksbergense]
MGAPFNTPTTVNAVMPGSSDSWPTASVTANSIVRTPTKPAASVDNDTDCSTV